VQGLGAEQYNTDLDADYENKALENQIINVLVINGLIFVEKISFTKDFNFYLENITTKESYVIFANEPMIFNS